MTRLTVVTGCAERSIAHGCWGRLLEARAAVLALVVALAAGSAAARADSFQWTQAQPANSPGGRYGAAMAYDSDRGVTVVFGGVDQNGRVGDTWEWDGCNWTQRMPAHSPSARTSHAMVYDSARQVCVMFAGYDGSALSDTWEWDGTDWTQAQTAHTPSGRNVHAMAYDSARHMTVLFGGFAGGFDGQTWEYDGTDWMQRSPGSSPSARIRSAMVYDSVRGVAVLFGGQTSCCSVDNQTWEWNGTTWSQRSPATSPQARYVHAMAYDSGRGVTVLFGGDNAGGGNSTLGDTWEWNGTNWTQATPPISPEARTSQMMAYDSSQHVVVMFGGGTATAISNETWKGDVPSSPFDWTQRLPATSPTARSYQAMAYDSTRHLTLLFGGCTTGGASLAGLSGDSWAWNGTNWAALSPAASPSPRLGSAMADDSARGVIVLFGGFDGSNLDETWEWDGTNWTQRFPANRPPARRHHAMAYDATRHVTVAFGGYNGSFLNDTWEWDGTDWTQRTPANSPGTRYGHEMAYDSARGVTVLFGGTPGGNSWFDDTWEWDGTNWTQQSPAASPSARGYPAMAYDSARGVTILFGGSNFDINNETWAWDGANWIQLSTSVSPPARDLGTMAYDIARGTVVMFGGESNSQNDGSVIGDTWESGMASPPFNWTQRMPATSPPGRVAHGMAYDSIRHKTVLFGGVTSSGHVNDTWEWDGSTWTQKFPANNPSAREVGAMAFDSTRGVAVLFGGFDTWFLNDTWEWDGTNWTQRSPSNSPSAREIPAMSYDSGRHVIVLFGGSHNGTVNDTWEWDGTNWTQRSSSGPAPRVATTMSYDSVRGVTVLFGGLTGGSVSYDDTWEWDGNNWTQRSPAHHPSARYVDTMVYDASRGVSVLFGGLDIPGNLYNETWEWNGTDWTQAMPATSPSPRVYPRMVYDSARSMIVLFGGSTQNDPNNGETWEGGAASPAATASSNSPICAGETLQLFGGPNGASYAWTGPNGFSSNLQNPTIASATTNASGTYTLTVTGNGCPAAADTSVTVDSCDDCPDDPNKTEPGQCGCGVPDDDNDNDSVADCLDNCPDDSNKTEPGQCGCGVADDDGDSDNVPDCLDVCPGYNDHADCNTNGTPDGCDIAGGTSADICPQDGTPDECQALYWRGPDGGSFTGDPANWEPATTPSAADTVVLLNTGPTDNRCNLNTSGQTVVCSLSVQGTGGGRQHLQVAAGSELRVLSALHNEAGGVIQARSFSQIIVNASQVSQSGRLELRSLGGMRFDTLLTNSAGGFINILGGTLSVDALHNATGAILAGFGTIDGDAVNEGNMIAVADVQVVGNLSNGGTITIQGGILTVTGTLSSTGTLIGGSGGRDGSENRLVVRGDLDLAAGDFRAVDLTRTTVEMSGGPAAGPQHLETFAQDFGRDVTLPNAALFSMAVLRIGPTQTTVQLVDNRDNSPGADQEALYVERLVLEPGTTLDLAGHSLYYIHVTPLDPTATESGITILDSVGGGRLCPIAAPAGRRPGGDWSANAPIPECKDVPLERDPRNATDRLAPMTRKASSTGNSPGAADNRQTPRRLPG